MARQTTKDKVLKAVKDIQKGMREAHSTKEAITIGLSRARKAAKKAMSAKPPRKVSRHRTRTHAHA